MYKFYINIYISIYISIYTSIYIYIYIYIYILSHFYTAKLGYAWGIPIFINFAPKHRLCVHFRTRDSNVYLQSLVYAKI